MGDMRKISKISLFAVFAAVAAPAFASNIATIDQDASGTAVTLDSNPVITAVLSAPNTVAVDGYTYSNYAILANDGTGSVELFGHLPTGSTYVPTVGDAISVSGTFSPFDGIPEIETLTSIAPVSSGNPVPSPVPVTIEQIQTSPTYNDPTGPNNYAGYLTSLSDVEFSKLPASGLFPTHSTLSLALTDGTDTVTAFFWPSSYSSVAPLGGTAIPTGPVNVIGFEDVFDSATEFVPISITSVPEPMSMSILGLGGMALLARRRRHA
jgi:hypothetical protein